MYDCFKLGFYSRLGLSGDQEIPELNTLIKAAYDNNPIQVNNVTIGNPKGLNPKTINVQNKPFINSEVGTEAWLSAPPFELPTGGVNPKLNREIVNKTLKFYPNTQAAIPTLPKYKAELIGTPYGKTVEPKFYDASTDVRNIGGLTGLSMLGSHVVGDVANFAKPQSQFTSRLNSINAFNARPGVQFGVNTAIMGPTAIRWSELLGEQLGVSPGTQTAMDVAAVPAAGLATTGIGLAGAKGVEKLVQAVPTKYKAPVTLAGTVVAGTVPFVPMMMDNAKQQGSVPTANQWAENLNTGQVRSDVMASFINAYSRANPETQKELMTQFWSNPDRAEEYLRLLSTPKYNINSSIKRWKPIFQAGRPQPTPVQPQ